MRSAMPAWAAPEPDYPDPPGAGDPRCDRRAWLDEQAANWSDGPDPEPPPEQPPEH